MNVTQEKPRFAQVMIDEFRRADIPPFDLPEPSSAAMRGITNLIREHPLAFPDGGSIRIIVRDGRSNAPAALCGGDWYTLGRWRSIMDCCGLEELERHVDQTCRGQSGIRVPKRVHIGVSWHLWRHPGARYFARTDQHGTG